MEQTELYDSIYKFLSNKSNSKQKYQELPFYLKKEIKKYKITKCTGHLYYCNQGNWLKVLQLKGEQMQAIKEAHEDTVSGLHNDANKTFANVSKSMKYHWNSMLADVKSYINSCSTCVPATASRSICQSKNWKQVVLNILGPFTITNGGNKFVVVMMDPLSLWIDGSALKSNSNQEITNFILKIFMRMGFCECTFLLMPKTRFKKLSAMLNALYCKLLDSNCLYHTSSTVGLQRSRLHGTVRKKPGRDGASVPSCKNVVPCNIIESFVDVNVRFGGKFSKTLTEYTSSLHATAISSPQTWDENLETLFFKWRCNGNECDKSPFYKMFQRSILIEENDLCKETASDKSECDDSGTKKLCSSQGITSTKDLQPVEESSDVDHPVSLQNEKIRKTKPDNGNFNSSHIMRDQDIGYHLKQHLKGAVNSDDLILQNSKRTYSRSRNVTNGIETASVQRKRPKANADEDSETKDNTSLIEVNPTTEGNELGDIAQAKEVHVTIVADNIDDDNIKNEVTVCDNNSSESPDRTENYAESTKKTRPRKLENELPHRCPKCIATYVATVDELQFHLSCHVEDSLNLKCPGCPRNFRNWSHLTRHLTCHSELSNFAKAVPEVKRTCSYCNKLFSSREGKTRHELVIHQGVRTFHCNICKVRFKERKTWKRHMDVHANVIHKCELCNYSTKVLQYYNDHVRIHEGRGFACPVCKKVFAKRTVLRGHIDTHNADRSAIVCELCGVTLSNAGSWRQHVKNMHDESENRTYPCSQCNYIGKTKSNLTGHTDRCHNKPFKCNMCSYCTKSDKSLRRHVDIFHNETERRYACSSCPYRARDPKHLFEHVRLRHVPDSSRFPCKFCSLKFKTMTQLRHHLPSHTGQHLYRCLLCGYSAKYRQTVHRHVKVKHPGETPGNVVKGTPCSEIPFELPSDQVPEDHEVVQQTMISVAESSEQLMVSGEESNLYVANILTNDSKPTKLILDASSITQLTVDETALTMADGDAIQFRIVEADDSSKNLNMDLVPALDQRNTSVELVLVEVKHDATEITAEESVVSDSAAV